MPTRRFPRSVYGAGQEPDPRFSMANERTFLAWVRTSLAFIAGGVALETFDLPIEPTVGAIVSHVMLAAAVVLPAVAWTQWKAAETAMRHGRPLPANTAMPVLVAVVTLIGALVLIGQLL